MALNFKARMKCPICKHASIGSDYNITFPVRVDGRIESWSHDCVICGVCAFAYDVAPPSAETLESYYSSQSPQGLEGGECSHDYDAKCRLDVVRRFSVKRAVILEVGAGDGFFCDLLAKYGYISSGIDVVKSGTSERVTNKFLRSVSTDEVVPKYDVIVSYYVLEHVFNPADWVASVFLHLRVGGVLIIEVPDFEKFPFNAIHAQHLQYFTRFHIATLIRSCGFEVLSVDEKPSRFFGLTIVARKSCLSASTTSLDSTDGLQRQISVEKSHLLMQEGLSEWRRRQEYIQEIAKEINEQINRGKGEKQMVVLWPHNDISMNILDFLDNKNLRFVRVIDASSRKLGLCPKAGVSPVAGPIVIQNLPDGTAIFLCSPAYNESIEKFILSSGLSSKFFLKKLDF